MSEHIDRAVEVPKDYCGYMLVGQRGGRGGRHVVWVGPTATAAAYPPEGICDRDTWISAEPLSDDASLAEHDRAVAAKALRDAADDMGDTDDPDAIYVDNGDADVWLRARADRIEAGESDG